MPRRAFEATLTILLAAACAPDARDISAARQPVIGGTPTAPGQYPATGAIMTAIDSADPELVCTGTLIAPDVVLTAAHCLGPPVIEEEMPGFTLALDTNTAPPAEIAAGLELHPHPDYDPMAAPVVGLDELHDIGLLVLAEAVDGVEVEVLPTAAEGELLQPDLIVDIVGYGVTEPGAIDFGVKHHASAHVVEVGERELLISDPGEPQNCHGDSGGPALADMGNGRRVVGIVSRAPDPDDPSACDQGGVDTRVDAYREWVLSVVDIPCADGGDCDGAGCDCRAGARGGGDGRPLILLLVGLAFVLRRSRAS